MQRTPNGDTSVPRFFSSLAARAWPHAGCSMAIVTTAASTSGEARFFRLGFERVISANARSPPFS